jgi:TonB-linked SusC/RagA family outer membrane protein
MHLELHFQKMWILGNYKLIPRLILICLLVFFPKEASSAAKLRAPVGDVFSVGEIIDILEKDNDFIFFYSADDIDLSQKVSINLSQVTIEQALEKICENTNLSYSIENRNVFIKPSEKPIVTQTVQQQNKVISGQVKDINNDPVVGATVAVKGTTKGTITDSDGKFSLTFSLDEFPITLLFSCIGFLSEEVVVEAETKVDVVLIESIETLGEVMVVAYGTAKKASFTGSAASVKGNSVSTVPVVEFTQALQGKVAGLSMGTVSGQPGSGVNIRIRGTGSINASKEPLYVIDGVPVINADMGKTNTLPGNIMSSINPSDIESVTVLKDAAASSLYGSRAANGVILITTKKGKEGKTVFSIKSELGMSDFAVSLPEVLDGERERIMKREALINYYLDEGYSEAQAIGQTDKVDGIYNSSYECLDDIAPVPANGYSDWESELFRTGITKSTELSARGGNERTKFFSSLSYLDQEGVMEESNFQRYSTRLNLDHKANETFSMGINTLLSATEQNGVMDRTTYYTNPYLGVSLWLGPTVAIYDEDGSYNTGIYSTFPNLAYEYTLNNINRTKTYRSFSVLYGEANILEGLKFRSTLGLDLIFTDFTYYSPAESRNGQSTNGEGSKSHRIWKAITSSNILSYQRSVNNIHNFDVLIGYEVESLSDEYTSVDGENYPESEDLYVLKNASSITGGENSIKERHMISYLSRLNYNFNDKYYLSASLRRDGNSTLAPDARWGNFWSLSGSWRITEEDFISVPSWFTDWKIRVSYGTNGTLPGGYYASQGLYSLGEENYNGEVGAILSSVENRKLTWEQNYSTDIATDFTLFERFSFEIEYYRRLTKDMLLGVPTSLVTGVASTTQNYGEMENHGFELTISSDNIRKENFSWNTTFTLGTVRNKILKINDDIVSDYQIQREGESYNSFYFREYAGVNPENGNAQWYINETNESGKIISREITEDYTKANEIVAGSPIPDCEGSLINDFKWKGFNLSFNFVYKFGGYTFDKMGIFVETDGKRFYAPVRANQWNRWQKEGDITDIPRQVYGNKSVLSTRYMHDADYIRLKNLTFSYNLPSKLVSRVGLEKTRFYVNAVNLWTWSKYDVYDPEVKASGIYDVTLPPLKTVTLGVEINF